jgi:2-keto-4-pentenoate hydratase/2-oxohepta-3-ene-1,7-dioic acid hydratase in catechol pathway
MKLATFLAPGDERPRVGVVDDDVLRPLDTTLAMRELIGLGLDAIAELARAAAVGDGHPLERVRLLAPLQPASVRDFVAFEEHVEGVRRSVDGAVGVDEAWYDAPTFYFTNPHSVIGPGDTVGFPARSELWDFELEVAAVIGVSGGSLGPDEARSAIFGYTLMNDWSARDLQGREMRVRLGPAKGKDFATTLGPCIVTSDELDAHRDDDGFLALWCTVSVNGVEVGRDLLSNMGWTFESMVVHASRDSRVSVGDVLGSGTVGNGGCLAELWGRAGEHTPAPLRVGDEVTLTVEGIGSLTNVVGVQDPGPGSVPPRRRSAADARAAHHSSHDEQAAR